MHEWAPLVRAWVRGQCGTLDEFWTAQPWEVAAVLGIGAYATEPSEEPGRVRSGGDRHPIAQGELIRQRVLHAKDPDRYPAPQPAKSTIGSVLGALG